MASPMGRRIESLLLLVMGIAFPLVIAWSTLDPWDVAVEKLSSLGQGPFIPVYFIYNSSSAPYPRTGLSKPGLYCGVSVPWHP